MHSTLIQFLSVLLLIGYYYRKTKDKIVAWGLSYLTFFFCAGVLFRKLFPDIPFVSPTVEYMVFLVIVGVPFLVLVVLVGYEIEKRRASELKEDKKDFTILFKPSRSNVIFWTVFVLLNLIAFLMENNK